MSALIAGMGVQGAFLTVLACRKASNIIWNDGKVGRHLPGEIPEKRGEGCSTSESGSTHRRSSGSIREGRLAFSIGSPEKREGKCAVARKGGDSRDVLKSSGAGGSSVAAPRSLRKSRITRKVGADLLAQGSAGKGASPRKNSCNAAEWHRTKKKKIGIHK